MVMMKVKFTLVMKDLFVEDKKLHLKPIDLISISWEDDLPIEKLLEFSQQWLKERNLLTKQIIGLRKVGESSLEIEPIKEEEY